MRPLHSTLLVVTAILLGAILFRGKWSFSNLLALPRNRTHWWMQLLWILSTLRFVYFVLQPRFDDTIRQEYLQLRGGLLTAWLLLFLLYLPFLVAYLAYISKQDRELKLGHDEDNEEILLEEVGPSAGST